MDGPGTITWEEFLENAERFLAVSNKLSDGWELHGDKVHPVLHVLCIQVPLARASPRYVRCNVRAERM